MLEKIPTKLNTFLFSMGKKSFFARILFLLMVLSLVFAVAATSYRNTFEQLTRIEISQKEFLAKRLAITVSEKINHFIDIGTSLAMNPILADAIIQGDSAKAREEMTGLPTLFPFIDQIFAADTLGTIVANYPGAQGAVGANGAYQEWYRGVMQTMRPYVSEVYPTSAEPKYNIIAITLPILPPGVGQGKTETLKNIQGVLALQIKLGSFEQILKPTQEKTGQTAYLVDQKGHIIYHPKFPSKNGITDFSRLPIMRKLLKGTSGAEVIFNSLEKQDELAVYEPVKEFGWGVVVSQPVEDAFADRDKALRQILIFYGVLALLSSLLVNLFLKVLHVRAEGEKKLQDSHSLLQAIVEGTSDMVFVKDREGRYVMINSVGARWLGKPQKEILGKLDIEILPEVQARQFIENDQKTMREGLLLDTEEILHLKGRDLILNTVRAPHHDHSGNILGVIGVSRDITERKRMEREVQEAAQLKSKFVSIATHELRSPLTALYESVRQVLDGITGPINDVQRKILEITSDNVRRMVDLTTEILDFQKFESGKMPFNMKEDDVRESIQTVYQTMHSLAEQKGLYFILQLGDNLPTVLFDRDKIVQVFVNLINNAIKFTEKGGIVLSAVREPNVIHFSIKDTGPGVASEELGKLFQPFGQVGSHKVKGTGLGLSICKEIIEGHHGRIWAESKVGEGTVMHFLLPVTERRQAR